MAVMMSALADWAYSLISDGSVMVGIGACILAFAKLVYDLRRDTNRHQRVLFGSDDDQTHDGLAVEQEAGFADIAEKLRDIDDKVDDIDDKMDRKFAEAERERRETRDKVNDLSGSFDQLTSILSRSDTLEHVDLLGHNYPKPGDDDRYRDDSAASADGDER